MEISAMTMLVLGVLIFAGAHLIPSLAPAVRGAWVGKLGENGYKGCFSLLLLIGMGLIVAGWRSTLPALIYMPVSGIQPLAIALLYAAFVLMAVSARPSRIKRVLRHPQLTGVLLWGIAHLILNGDNRSLVLFSGLALWALVEIIAINRREGAWVKPEAPPWSAELVTLLIAVVVISVIVFAHPWIAGVPVR